MSREKVTMIVDLQFGSTGKGLIAGWWSETFGPDCVIGCNMPNAGHTYIDSKGQKMVHKVLPSGICSPNLKYVMIGPGSVFDLARLHVEIEQAQEFGYLDNVEILIHPDAMVLQAAHKAHEQQTLSGISSTMQGSAAAQIDKMMRNGNAPTAANVARWGADEDGALLPDWFSTAVCTRAEWEDALRRSQNILAEGSQGWSLGINSGFYPYCTSRDCSPARFLSDMAIPHRMLKKVIGTARTFPIRVGNTPDGYSGDCYHDQHEVSFEELGVPDEFTTVTQRKRRIFTFSHHQIQEAAFYCCPDEIFLNFANYLRGGAFAINDDLRDLIAKIEGGTGVPVRYIGWGATNAHVDDRFPSYDAPKNERG